MLAVHTGVHMIHFTEDREVKKEKSPFHLVADLLQYKKSSVNEI